MAAPLRSTIPLQVTDGVYAPQEDSWLLSGVLGASGLAEGRRVLDICTGSGVLALGRRAGGGRSSLLTCAPPWSASGNAAASGSVESGLARFRIAAQHGPFTVLTCLRAVDTAPDRDRTRPRGTPGPTAGWCSTNSAPSRRG